MLDYGKLRDLAKTRDDGDAIYQIGEELIQSELRIMKALTGITRDVETTGANVQSGRETGGLGNVNGSEVFGLVEALGERNVLLRALKRLGVDPSKL